MYSGAQIWRTVIEAGAHHPPQLAMRIYTRANKFSPCCYNEIAHHALVHKVKVVVISPNIGAGAGDGVDLLFCIVLTATRGGNQSNISLVFKLTENMCIQ